MTNGLDALRAALDQLGDVPFKPFRTSLYTFAELTTGFEQGYQHMLDARIGSYYEQGNHALPNQLAQATHDACISALLDAVIRAHRASVVGVMGGHDVLRTSPLYREVALIGRALTRRGYLLATGGGPGVMEAANLGAWLAPHPDEAVDEALAVLAPAPDSRLQTDEYLRLSVEVLRRWPNGGASIGVPTWVYAHEPTSAFPTYVAKYFANSVRENGLLAIATAGIVFAPGGPGTEQEIFTDAAQNSYTAYLVRSPMVFLGRDHYNGSAHALVDGVRRQAELNGWPTLVSVVDTRDEVVAAIAAGASVDRSPPRPAAMPSRHRQPAAPAAADAATDPDAVTPKQKRK